MNPSHPSHGWRIGDRIAASPVGRGVITGVTERGYPRVNEIAVATFITQDGGVFNPHNHDLEALRTRSAAIDEQRSHGVTP
jgi:hypothetical protein